MRPQEMAVSELRKRRRIKKKSIKLCSKILPDFSNSVSVPATAQKVCVTAALPRRGNSRGNRSKSQPGFFAGIVQRLVRQPSKLDMRVRFPLPALGQRANECHKNRCSRWEAGIQETKYGETDRYTGVFAALFV